MSQPEPLAANPRESATEAVSRIMHTLTLVMPLRQTLNRIATELCTLMKFDACAILLPTEDRQRMLPEGSCGMPQEYLNGLVGDRAVKLNQTLTTGPTARAFTLGRCVVVSDTRTDPIFTVWRPLAEAHGYRSMVSVPLKMQNQIIGVMNGYSGAPRDMGHDELGVMQMVADQAAIAIELARRLQNQAQTIQQWKEAATALKEQHRLLEQSEAIHRELTEQVLQGHGIPAITRTLASLTECPALVWDAADALIAASDPLDAADGSSEPDAFSAPFAPLMQKAFIKPHLAQAKRERRPVRIPASAAEGLPAPLLIMPVLAGSSLIGYIGLCERDKTAGPLDIRAIEHGAIVLALEQMKQVDAAASAERRREAFVAALVTGQFEDDDTIRHRGRTFGCDLTQPHRVIIFAPRDLAAHSRDDRQFSRLRDLFLRTVASVCQEMIPGTLTAAIGDRAVAICPVKEEDSGRSDWFHQLSERVRSRLRTAVSGLQVSAAMGQLCRRPGDYGQAYAQARQCVRLLRQLRRNERSLAFEELGVYRLFLFNVKDPKVLAEQLHTVIEPLTRSDQERGTGLFETLACYLEHECDLRKAAEALFVHPNTLKYRLTRIRELTGRDLRNPQHLVELTLAVTAVQSVGIAADD